MSFQKTAALNVKADCTIAAEGWIHRTATTAAAGHQRTQEDFRNRPFDAAHRWPSRRVVNPPGLTCAALPH